MRIGSLIIQVRPAEKRDLPALAEFGLALARAHVELDGRRFVLPDGGAEAFLDFFNRELERPESLILLAEATRIPVGYAFMRMEPASIEALCGPSMWLHDVYVDPQYRGNGAGRQLVHSAIEATRRLGSTSLMLGVSPANTQAKQLYERTGMRATMIEMRLELDR
jgi:ribosomal protein S18 acetylase RimI-like enzyme